MDIDKYLMPEFDFSRIHPVEFEASPDVTIDELIYVFRNRSTRANNIKGYPLHDDRWRFIGFSQRFRCFELLVATDKYGKYVFLSFNLLNEYGIRLHWCHGF
jgi:hypothetical protein